MCGIGGAFCWSDGGFADPPSAAVALSAALAHRGPDGEGTLTDRGLVLVHRRLAIIDPTPAGRQPMTTPDGRYSIVYNGEIYNYRELRLELERAGVRFASASDTEVLLALIIRDGVAALSRARGMFALAVWDSVARSLTLARDRFGIKPLYVSAHPYRVAFASEVGALRRAGLVEREVSACGVLAFLAWAYIPSPLTWLQNVESLTPGTWARWHDNGLVERGTFADYAEPYRDVDLPGNECELRIRASEAIRDSVAAHLVADVPVGIFLSGGLDSAAIVASARDITSGPLHTYTVAGDVPSMSELEPARAVATHFETTHHELMIGAAAIERALPSIIRRLDAPSADAVNSYFVSQAVAATRVKAVLSGVGGDEMFGGYPSFRRIPSAIRTAKWLGPVLPMTARAAAAVPDWRARKLGHFVSTPDLASAYRAVRGNFMPEEWPALLGPAFDGAVGRDAAAQLEDLEARTFATRGRETVVAAVARFETGAYLRGQLLRDVDAVSMAHGLEVRMPFVDHRLASSIWPAAGHHPHLLEAKRLLRENLPRALPVRAGEGPKRGFTLPFDTWMRGALREPTLRGLECVVATGWVNARAAADTWSQWERGRAHWSRVWGLSVLGQFLQEAA
jgi:asparagine synthase (glutamine-hydrolysing)